MRMKKGFVLAIAAVIVIMGVVYFNTGRLDLDITGYAFSEKVKGETGDFDIYKAKVMLDAYLIDNNLNNDRIEISYGDSIIKANILLTQKDNNTWSGDIIRFDNANAQDEILGDITLLDKGKECLIQLYNENLTVIAPEENEESAAAEYMDFSVHASK